MNWLDVTLEMVTQRIRNGMNVRQSSTPDGLPISRIETISKSEIDESKVGYAGIKPGEADQWLLTKGEILFSHINSESHIGKCAIYKGKPDKLIHGMNLLALRPAQSLIIPEFLMYLLRSPQFRAQLPQITKRAVNQASISIGNLNKIKLLLPPLSEQRRIVEILDQADALRKKRVQAGATAKRILPALFLKMFGNPGTNPMGWDFSTLEKRAATVRYGLGQPPKSSEKGLPLIRATNIKQGTIREKDLMRVSPNDVPASRNAFLSADEVIVVRSGAYTGDVAQVTARWAGSVVGYDLVITPGENFCGEFLETYLLSPYIQKGYFGNLKARAGQPHLNAAQLLATPVPIIPKDLQLRFAANVRIIRKMKEPWEDAQIKLEALFLTLLYRAFSGELTAKWREEHMRELLTEMEAQKKELEAADSQAALPL